ncbi:mucin-2-like [Chanos chanos]|uniref:Mucin-2-like n=1 Tax=Chanos chanos TaxID=29144 RepID=A0A6J2WRI4_CHACN|nr:mucin-2-like [Chanos chanos]
MKWATPLLFALVLALTWALHANTMRARSTNHVKSICSTWGNWHFKTFDGDVFQFPGSCEYNLASDCQGPVPEFSIHVWKSKTLAGLEIQELMVTFGGTIVELNRTAVKVDGKPVTLPYHVLWVLLEENSVYIKIYSKQGITVMWNRDDAVMVELDSKYANRTCGLCGDFNGLQIYNEFIHGYMKMSAIEYGNKQKIHNPYLECEDPNEEDDIGSQQLSLCQGHHASCADLLLSDDWASCTAILNPDPYIQACTLDKCRSPPGDTSDNSLICATLSEYSRQCSHAGGTPPNWRTSTFCAVQCPYNMVHSESGSPCVDTCTYTDTSSLCQEHKMDGCFCPEGTVFDDISLRGCIPQTECQCKHDRVYDTGEIFQNAEEQCVCYQGKWECNSLPSSGFCALEEGSHFTTYDGKEFTFHGECNYVISKDCAGSKFSILGQLIPCSTIETDTCLKSIMLILNKDKTNVLSIKADGRVRHNADVQLPYSTANLTVFRPSTFYIMVQTNFGLHIKVQLVPLMQLYITLDHSYQNRTCGLCGNFNNVLKDELKSPQGLVEGTAASFANSWKTQTTCPDRTERLDDPCSYSVVNENYAEHWCSNLKSKESPFSKCHSTVSPDNYYKRCKYASCNCDRSEDCLCAVFSSYVRACASKGIFLQGWRSLVCEKYTEQCPVSQVFSYKLQQCQSTCQSLSSERQVCSTDFVPVDGCSCPEGQYQDEHGMCVPVEQCSCYHDGEYIKPGKSIYIKDQHCVCSNGKLSCQSRFTRIPLACPDPKVYFNCSTANPDEYGVACARSCLSLEQDCVAMECESGCMCPSGLLDDGRGNCVKDYECPCQHNGHFYAAGSRISIKCNTCNCKMGKWECTGNVCPGTCTIYGSGHYNTFDDQRFGFSGSCNYVAAQDTCGNKTGSFRVITENVPCGMTGATCSKYVRIILGRTELRLADGRVEQENLEQGALIPYRVRTVGLYMSIEADIGLTVLWDRKTAVHIILQPQYMGEVCGLCGNFNGNGKDDFTTPAHLLVTDVLEFANSWKDSSGCPNMRMVVDPCSQNPNRLTWAKMQCSIITGKTFQDCHSMVDPAPYYDNCVTDSCACDSGGDCECFCTAVAAYAQACNDAGVCVAWRTPEICPVYCDYYNEQFECIWHYSPCHTPCYKTCYYPEGVCTSPIPNLEVCPEDKPIFDERNNICVEKCEGCYHNGTWYEPGDEIPTDELCQKWWNINTIGNQFNTIFHDDTWNCFFHFLNSNSKYTFNNPVYKSATDNCFKYSSNSININNFYKNNDTSD